ncbi:MAG: hypothetical protein ACLTS9_11545 [Sutterella wadsworthensis]
MNIKMVFADRIDSWDTRADGGATTTHAALEVSGQQLVLWSALTFDNTYNEKGVADKTPERQYGTPAAIAEVEATGLKTLPEFLDALGEEKGLLRLDVDGEAIWTASASPDGDAEAATGGGFDDFDAMG